MPKIPFRQFKALLANRIKSSKKFLDVDAEARKYLNAVSPYWQKLGREYGIAIEHRLPEKNVNIHEEIKKLVAYYKKEHKCSLFDINNGYCGDFADELVEKTGGLVIGVGHSSLLKRTTVKTEYGPSTMYSEPDMPGHVWIFWKGKHYDAENPQGVKNWKDLKIFKSQGVFDHERKDKPKNS